MKHRIRKLTSLLLSLSLISALTLPAAASNALGEDLSAKDTLLHQETQLSTNVFWSTTYSDLRTENLITYTPNKAVTPIVTYGDALTDRSSVADTAALLEEDGYRVVAGINGDFYNVSTGLPIGMVVTEGLLRSSDAGYYAIGFRADGSAILGKPGVKVSANLGYAVDDGFGNSTELVRPVAAVNKARTNSGLYLYTYDFNAKHTTGTTEPGINVVCTVEQGKLAIGSTVTLRVDRVEETAVTSLAPDQIVLSANLQADSYYTTALQNIPQGSELTLTVSANDGWEDVEYAIGALYCLAENGAVVPNLAAGSNPRTAVGQKADGTLVFYTIDGRKTGHSIGASLTQVGERLLELGCQTVLCLDGGGSTNLAVTTPDSTTATIINRPSETGRKVTNQVFLVASDRSSGRLDHFYVNAAGDYVLAGSAVSVTASGVDSNYIPMDASYTLSASAGSIAEQEDGRYLLTTPASGGDITVTASGRGAKGSTVVHAIRNPDNLTLKNGASNLTELTVTPGSKTAFTAGAVWNHLPLTATNEAFTWSVSGDIGTVDEHGVFTASAPGTGNLTGSAGDKSLTIPVTVAQVALQTIEDFETPDTRFFSGYYLTVSRTNASDYVQRGHYAGKLDYVLPEDTGYYSQAMAGSFSNLQTPYTALNLWVYGDGSGNALTATVTDTSGAASDIVLTGLDFTGWKQVTAALPENAASIRSLNIIYSGGEKSIGTLYLDQFTTANEDLTDTTPPAVTVQVDGTKLTAYVSDNVDKSFAAAAISLTRDGEPVSFNWKAESGTLTATLPADDGRLHRVTVTAVDQSGNIGRGSADILPDALTGDPDDAAIPADQGPFVDMISHWAGLYTTYLYNMGVVQGLESVAGTVFQPDKNITRGEFALMVARWMGLDLASYSNVELPFADASSIASWALDGMKAMYAEGIIKGSLDSGTLVVRANDSISRAEAMTILGRIQDKGYVRSELTFSDAGDVASWALPYVQSLVGQGIISGYDNQLRPNDPVKRGEVAKMLYCML